MGIIVTRPFDGIFLNAGHREALLDAPDGDEIVFDSVADAKSFLLNNGVEEDDMDWFDYEDADEWFGRVIGRATI